MTDPNHPDITLRDEGEEAARARSDKARPWTGNGNGNSDSTGKKAKAPTISFHICDAGLDIGDVTKLAPRPFLLATVFCRGNTSMLAGVGAVGKSSVRIAQYLALATKRNLTGEHVFDRTRVMLLSFEDDELELKRRIGAAMKYYNVKDEDVAGWFFFAALGRRNGKLAVLDKQGRAIPGELAGALQGLIVERQLGLVGFDPFVKAHSIEENSADMDSVMEVLTDMAKDFNIATDVLAHFNKGQSEPGDANRVRGSGAQKDAARLVYTLTAMDAKEAKSFGISERDRKEFIRMDRGKVNYGRSSETKWFHLVGVKLGNCDAHQRAITAAWRGTSWTAINALART